ncbi:NUDIX domain-containing protein [Micromonospora sp. PSH03]|uniref:NUDIX domain-containing protein n=1 Tax=Micromonospora salmantinae TaxID=2911211 RepID=UPI001EE82331|nr:NUDIX domain-containing protein [Micromonospora salmantinae]MCG5460017.1 NUDIX domain-containing protein [Micromonospora salmantinae]
MHENTTGEPGPWRILGERTVYEDRWLRLDLVDVEPPGLEPFAHHVVRLDRVAVVAVLDEHDRVLMLRRYRFIPGETRWELPGGIVEPGEEAVAAASREAEEETGWRPSSLTRVVAYQPMIGMVDSPHEIFVGRGATYVGPPTDAEEAGRVEWVPLSDMPDLMARGELAGSGTLVAILHVIAGLTPNPSSP